MVVVVVVRRGSHIACKIEIYELILFALLRLQLKFYSKYKFFTKEDNLLSTLFIRNGIAIIQEVVQSSNQSSGLICGWARLSNDVSKAQ